MLQADASAAFNDDRAELLAKGEALEAELTGEPENVARNEEEKQVSLRELERVLAEASAAVDERWHALRDEVVRPPDRHRPRRRARVVPQRVHAPAVAARVDVHEGAQRRGLHGHARGSSASTWSTTRTSGSTSTTGRRSRRARASSRRIRRRSSTSSRARREGCTTTRRSSTRPATRSTSRARSVAAVHVPAALRDHALTEIYSYILEAITREPGWHAAYFGLDDEPARENAERDALLRDAALPPLRREAAVRARLLVAVQRGRRRRPDGYADRLTNAVGLRYRERRVPVGHGCRLLLRRLPARVDPLGAAARVPAARGRRGLVARRDDRRAPARALLRGDADRRARRSPAASASSRSTPRRSSPS